jgi:ParB family chromosome partitioning protein
MTNSAKSQTQAAEPVSGVEIFVALNKLKKSPRNARKVPHGEAAIEALAASIQHKGMIQNLVVEPELESGQPTGFYFVTAGEGRRLAQLLRAKRKQIKKSQPIRCYVDTENDAAEISLDENVTRTAMHPADQFERFHELSRDKGWGVEEIGARFGVSPDIVRRRLRLGAVSPKLMDIYRQDGLTLDQLSAFAITDDHARQEQVFENLSYNKEPWIIRRDLTADKVRATDRRAIFVGADAYVEAGGTIMRDLFTEDHGGFFEDAALLDKMVIEKLREVAGEVQAEGWKWAEASIDFPYDHCMRRYSPELVALSDEDEARLTEAMAQYDDLVGNYLSLDEIPEDIAAKAQALDVEMDALAAKRSAYDPDLIARGGLFVSLNSQGQVRIERGFVRPEDEPQPEPSPEDEDTDCVHPEGECEVDAGETEEEEGTGKPLSDSLVRDLTAHRTLGLRLALGDQPDVALVALTHALVSDLFYRSSDATCLEIRVSSRDLRSDADGIADTRVAEVLADRHELLAQTLPASHAELWAFLIALDGDSLMALLAHCVALSVNAVKVPWERKTRALAAADELAEAVALDMGAHWTPTVRSYFGRITKAQIAEGVSEAVSPEAAANILGLKKPDMAEAAEQLVASTGWLPPVLRAMKLEPDELEAEPDPEAQSEEPESEVGEQPSEAEAPNPEAQAGDAGDALAPWEEAADLAVAAE